MPFIPAFLSFHSRAQTYDADHPQIRRIHVKMNQAMQGTGAGDDEGGQAGVSSSRVTLSDLGTSAEA